MKGFETARTMVEVVLVVAVVAFATHVVPSKPQQHIPQHHSQLQSYWVSDVVFRVPTDKKVVALTFDDGPHPQFTPDILNILDKYHIKATFLW